MQSDDDLSVRSSSAALSYTTYTDDDDEDDKPVTVASSRKNDLIQTFDDEAQSLLDQINQDLGKSLVLKTEKKRSRARGILGIMKGVIDDFLVPPEIRP
mmetsp:Transcript_3388/g.11641  ORF Transcript_3388/g.11641 Transcript_3388/m.11641 type:complete len:99 (-) Transcript_3388:3469-3765(-)